MDRYALREKLRHKLYYSILFWKSDPAKPKKTWQQEIKDWVIAFVVAATVYFIILPAILGTTSPLVVVSSCSEAGYLNIGDVLVLQGIKMADINAPTVSVGDSLAIAPIFDNDEVTALNISGHIVSLDRGNDIVVYVSRPYGAQIIHRAFVKINTSQGVFLITKGDANQYPDQFWFRNGSAGMCWDNNDGRCISTVVSEKMLVGKKTFVPIPILGHIKLFFCDATLGVLCDGHSNAGTGREYKLWC